MEWRADAQLRSALCLYFQQISPETITVGVCVCVPGHQPMREGDGGTV